MKTIRRHISLTPGFNPVGGDAGCPNRFNGFPRPANKPLKRFSCRVRSVTGLKPGVNEKPLAAISEQQKAVERLVEKILAAKAKAVGLRSASSPQAAADVSQLERELDEWVYALYGLTPEEIKIVEGSAK